MAKQSKSPIKQNGTILDNNVIAPVSYATKELDFSSDEALDNARESQRTSTGLSSLEKKLAKTKPGSPEYVRLSAKLKKKNFRRESRSIKKNIRKFGADADLSNTSTEFKNNLELGGSVGDVASRVNKRFDKFLDKNTFGDALKGENVDRRSIYNTKIEERDNKIAQDIADKKANDGLVNNTVDNYRNPSLGFNMDFGLDGSSSLASRTNNTGPITGLTYNPSKLPGQFSIIDALNNNSATLDVDGPPQKGDMLPNKRPFIANTNSITAGKPISKMLKNFK
tara:strand:+ start:5639 stop:6481 length:843 start_codon:yes stop_codon:yes gene_type:complete